MKKNLFILCKGRHVINIDAPFLFEIIEDPSNIEAIEFEALKKLSNCEDEVNIIVTGLTQATVAVIKACHKLNLKLVLWHFNMSRGERDQKPVDPLKFSTAENYIPQRVY